jgi:hypothetical protein
VFRADAPVRLAHLILTTFDTAEAVFDQEGLATDFLVWCAPERAPAVAGALRGRTVPGRAGPGTVRYRVATSEDRLPAPPDARRAGGALALLFLPAFACGALVLTVTSGAGLPERRREVAILKATGWQTDEILLRAAVESATLGLLAAGTALLCAWVWLHLLSGYGVAVLFVPGAEPGLRIPYRLTPVPVLLAFILSLALVLVGTLFASWRAAVAEPRDAMR